MTLCGAAGEVTGSCTLIETDRARVLVDAGMIQGAEEVERRNVDFPDVDVASLDAVIVTHAHVDHCGRLPMLAQLGFEGVIYAARPTAELLGPILHGSARLQVIKASEWVRAQQFRPGAGVRSLRGASTAPAPLKVTFDEPPPRLFGSIEVDAVLGRVRAVDYLTPKEIAPGVSLRLLDAGHVIGSASVELTITAAGGQRIIVLSGDIGPSGQPLLDAPTPPSRADVMVLESTYGDRVHPDPRRSLDTLGDIIDLARDDDARVIMPTFTLGRAQTLLCRLAELSREGRLKGTPVYLDSKMAVVASEMYARHAHLLTPRARERFQSGDSPLHFPELVYIHDRADSMRLNHLRSSAVIVAGSGFCHGGPIVHHLAHGARRADTRLVLIGHQPAQTPAGAIARGEKRIQIIDREIDIDCHVHTLPGFSGHADREGLLRFATGAEHPPATIVLNHGEPGPRDTLAAAIRERSGTPVSTPAAGDVIEIV